MENYPLEFCYNETGLGVHVGVNFVRHYCSTVPAAQFLEKRLKEEIPFAFMQHGETQIKILTEPRDGMLSVEMNLIMTDDDKTLALQKFRERKWVPGFLKTK